MWVLSLLNFPIPLETECYVKLTVPADLAVTLTTVEGSGLFAPVSGYIVQGIDKVDNADGSTTIKFESCFNDRSVGPSPQGRLSISSIKTPLTRRDSGKFQFELYKDYAYESKIAVLRDDVYIRAFDLEAGVEEDMDDFGTITDTDHDSDHGSDHDSDHEISGETNNLEDKQDLTDVVESFNSWVEDMWMGDAAASLTCATTAAAAISSFLLYH